MPYRNGQDIISTSYLPSTHPENAQRSQALWCARQAAASMSGMAAANPQTRKRLVGVGAVPDLSNPATQEEVILRLKTFSEAYSPNLMSIFPGSGQ